MEFAYRPEGLSLNLRIIVDNPAHLARAREAMVSLVVLLIISLLALIPEQGRTALGIELLAFSMLLFGVVLRLQASTLHHLPAHRRRSWIVRLIGLNSANLAITIAGASLLMRGLGGLLWLMLTILICLLWSTYNAWNLVIHARGTVPRGVNGQH